MKKFVFIYYSKDDMSEPPEEDSMKAWMDWFGSLGDKLVDGGNPFNSGAKAVTKSGVSAVKEMPATGYSIVNAGSMDEAVKMAKGSPMLSADDTAVCVYEALPM